MVMVRLGVGGRRAALYRKLGISSIYDLLTFYPRDYLDPDSVTNDCRAAFGLPAQTVSRSDGKYQVEVTGISAESRAYAISAVMSVRSIVPLLPSVHLIREKLLTRAFVGSTSPFLIRLFIEIL